LLRYLEEGARVQQGCMVSVPSAAHTMSPVVIRSPSSGGRWISSRKHERGRGVEPKRAVKSQTQGTVNEQALNVAAAHEATMRMSPYCQPQQVFWSQETIFLAGLQQLIINQVHYYFSTENLCKDEFLRLHMDREGWLPIELIATFNRLRHLTTDIGIVTEALKLSPELEVCDGYVRKRHDWQRWLLPANKPIESTIDELNGDNGGCHHVPAEADDSPPQSPASVLSTPSSPGPTLSGAPTAWRNAAFKFRGAQTRPLVKPTLADNGMKLNISASTAALPASLAPLEPPISATLPQPDPADGKSHQELLKQQSCRSTPLDLDNAHSPVSTASMDGGWETPSHSKSRSRRRARQCSEKQATQSDLKQVKPVPPTQIGLAHRSGISVATWASISDEGHSDETMLMAEDDWASSSASSLEEPAPPSTVTEGLKDTVRLRMSSLPKRINVDSEPFPYESRGAPKSADKARTRACKLSEALATGCQQRRSPDVRSSRSVTPSLSNATAVLTKQWLCLSADTSLSPRVQRLLFLPPTQLAVQTFLGLFAISLLCVMPQRLLPPALLDSSYMQWIEIPLGIFLALKFNEVGSVLHSLFMPTASVARSV